ncbi:MAG: MFS transporter [Clostridiales bacterium]|nr:MFS transporter [Clostridiales bacterium]
MERTSRQLTIKYALLQSTYWISQCTIYGFAAVYLQYNNFNNTQVGIVLSLSAILSIILQPVVSAFADKSKKKTVRNIILILLLLGFTFAIILNIKTKSLIFIGIVFILINGIQFTINPLLNSYALEYLNNGYPLNFGLARGTGSIAFAITSFFLGHGITKFTAKIIVPFFIFSYVFLFLAAYLFRIKNTNKNNISNHSVPEKSLLVSDKDKNPPASILGFFLKYKKFTLMLLGITMLFYSHNIINTYLINIMENVGGNSSDLGLSLTIAAALELPTMAAFAFLIKRVKSSTLIKASAFFFMIKSLLVFIAANVLTVHLSQAFQMLSFALFTPASVYYVNTIINKEDRNKGQAMMGVATIGASGTIAFITGGKLLDTRGASHMLLIGFIVSILGFIITCISTEKSDL